MIIERLKRLICIYIRKNSLILSVAFITIIKIKINYLIKLQRKAVTAVGICQKVSIGFVLLGFVLFYTT